MPVTYRTASVPHQCWRHSCTRRFEAVAEVVVYPDPNDHLVNGVLPAGLCPEHSPTGEPITLTAGREGNEEVRQWCR